MPAGDRMVLDTNRTSTAVTSESDDGQALKFSVNDHAFAHLHPLAFGQDDKIGLRMGGRHLGRIPEHVVVDLIGMDDLNHAGVLDRLDTHIGVFRDRHA